MNNLKIRTKLIMGFVLMAIISAIVGYVGISQMKTIAESDKDLYEVVAIPLGDLCYVTEKFQASRALYRDVVISDDMAEINKIINKRKQYSEEIGKYLSVYEKSIRTDAGKEIFAKVTSARSKFVGDVETLEDMALKNEDSLAYIYIKSGDLAESVKLYDEAIAGLITNKIERGKFLSDSNSATADSSTTVMIIIIIFSIIIGLVLGFGISGNIQNIINSIVKQVKELAEAAVGGRLATRAKPEEVNEEFREIALGVNKTLDAVINPLNVAANYVDRISKGDIPAKITDTYNGDFNTIKNNLNQCIDAVNQMVADAGMLAKAAVDGKLATRADATKHWGDFRKIVEGVNNTLDAVINPLNVAANYVDRISKGDIPDKITDSYNGDFNLIKNNLNQCINAVNLMVTDAAMLTNAALDGKLATRADATKHQGDFKRVVEGVNNTLNYVINPLNLAANYVEKISKGEIPAKITDAYNGDFNTIKNNLNQCIDAINSLVGDAAMLTKAAVDGKLATRADATKHWGDFRKIVEGVNNTLDAVINPLNVAAKYVERISVGDMPQLITDTYNGDFNTIKNNLNVLITATNQIIEKAKQVSKGDLDIQLQKRSDKDELMQALSEMVKAIAYVVAEVKSAADNVATSSQEMSSTTQSMSQGANEQASAAEEVSSSMEQMVANINQNADNAQQTDKIALKASADIAEGAKAVEQTVSSMKNIAQKIGIVSEIADKIDLLAINAAIEAARAGEHGKGFAVVAAEVRKLAERSMIAAKEINDVSSNSVAIAERSGKLLSEIVPDIQKTARLVQEISASSIEMNSGAGQVNNAIQQLNQVTQQNAASSEELSSSSEELAAQAEQLKDVIGFFKLDESNVQTEKFQKKLNVAKQKKQTAIQNMNLSHHNPKGAHIEMHNSEDGFEKF